MSAQTQFRNPKPKPWENIVAMIAVILVVVLLLATSCSPRIIEHIRYQHDTTYVEHFRVDSAFRKDSVFIKEKNDTVYQYVEKIRERYRMIHDTTYVHQVDTVMCEHIVEVKVEKPLTPWQNFRMTLGTIAIFATLLALAIWAIRKFVFKL